MSGADENGIDELPDCDWCDDKVHRLNGNVDIELCATCLHKGQCGWAPDKEDRDYSVGTESER